MSISIPDVFRAVNTLRLYADDGFRPKAFYRGLLDKHGKASDCIACGQCMTRGLGRCTFDDDICNRIAEKLDEIDALVVGSPVYYGQPNGALLAVMQRLLFSAGGKLENKPAANIAICRRGGATAAFQTMNMMFQMVNMPLVTSQYWNIAYGREAGEAAKDAEGMQTMRTLADNMAWLLKKIHAGGNPDYPEREEWQPMHFIR